jgi:hypothetical protein
LIATNSTPRSIPGQALRETPRGAKLDVVV